MLREKILIVEDEENERTGMAELLGAWGYETETAEDGVEGLAKVESWNPGIVITDLKMPAHGWHGAAAADRELSRKPSPSSC